MKQINSMVYPPGKIGIIGGGQLGRMLIKEAKRMGYKVVVLESSETSPAAQMADEVIIGSVKNNNDIRKLVEGVDVTTYEFESINADILCQLELEGFKIIPSGNTLKKIQNKYLQKKLFEDANLPVPQMAYIREEQDITAYLEGVGYPIVIKACSGGYDGKGNYIIHNDDELSNFKVNADYIKNDYMIEEFIKFEEELSIIIARNDSGDIKYYPIVKNEHKNSILNVTTAPARVTEEIKQQIIEISTNIINLFNDSGVFCIEFFKTNEGKVYINEVAPRPHNSGHYTIEGCITSQFEQQLRAVVGLPLGSTEMISPAAMINILGDKELNNGFKVSGLENILNQKNVYFHFYGKDYITFDKKVGHITVLDKNENLAREKALEARNNIYFEED